MRPLTLFSSYAHEDARHRKTFGIQLAGLERQGVIREWYDGDIVAGDEWDAQIRDQLDKAELIVLLITPDFIASDFCWGVEMQRAIERHEAGSARVIPIIVRPADWTAAPFAKLQVLPSRARPITLWPNRDAAWLDAIEGIRRAVAELADKRDDPPELTQRPDRAGAAEPPPTRGARAIHDAQGQSRADGPLVRAEGDPPTGDPAVDEAYDGIGLTREFFAEAFGRDSIDGEGMPLVAIVHYEQQWNNAVWNGTRLLIGDGDGVTFDRLTRPLDVIPHQLATAVIQYTAALEYWGQSGALNHSVATVFGVLAKQYKLGETADQADWLLGAGLLVDGTAISSLSAPGSAHRHDPQVAHMRDYVETEDDNGGVHINSGIPNHAFYLAANALGGHAWERAGRIWYDTLTDQRLHAQASFSDFARLTIDNAARLFDRGDTITRAWEQVGVA